jgi:hypothetical protein
MERFVGYLRTLYEMQRYDRMIEFCELLQCGEEAAVACFNVSWHTPGGTEKIKTFISSRGVQKRGQFRLRRIE